MSRRHVAEQLETRLGSRLLVRWLSGVLLGTLIIAASSPLFVRSYLTQSFEPTRNAMTLPPGAAHRWRSEGYATTRIGPWGMPGKRSITEPTASAERIALWGDSQVEGFCVPDDQKLFAQLERQSAGQLTVLPLARSGDDVADWIAQIPTVESSLAIDRHVVVIADLPDLLTAAVEEDEATAGTLRNLRAALPAFLLHAGRNLLTQADGTTWRSLRFRIGPVEQPSAAIQATTHPIDDQWSSANWTGAIERLQSSGDRPMVILYAPPSPYILAGHAFFQDPAVEQFAIVSEICQRLGVRLVSAQQAFVDAAHAGRWPHGFHNGQIGVGHLNADGYAILAKIIWDAIQADMIEREH
jgi:lysophospholipase L1-like esterase